MALIIAYISHYGYAAIAGLLAFGIIGLPVPDEMLMILVGYLSSKHVLQLPLAWLCSYIGSICGMTISYWIGRLVGASLIVRYGKWVGLTMDKYEKVQAWFQRYGRWTIFFSYFIPGVRHMTGYISGISGISFRKYFMICIAAALVWTVVFISLGYFAGHHFLPNLPKVKPIG
ncbi:DedA family protein [Paenibacillus campi]|uniref:DedA family protein n=1 Tax=Paenibacillus campi TaxID=3106031 RepID=UPI002AFF0503|nr:DedA family protein [Paenibacillus sp. SGZ-1009]